MVSMLRRRGAGLLWLSAWLLVVGSVHAPWLQLGGIVSETVRYWERVAVLIAGIAGCFVGATVRERAGPAGGASHPRRIWRFVGIPAAGCAACLAGLAIRSWMEHPAQVIYESPWIGVCFIAFLSYWAGFDAGVGAWPMLHGRGYPFSGPLPKPSLPATERDSAGSVGESDLPGTTSQSDSGAAFR